MSIADKLTTIAENQQKVFDAGKQAEYDRFWDAVQDGGNRLNYRRAFSGSSWDDDVYNPKYPILHRTSTAPTGMFDYNSVITDTKVPITVDHANISYMFRGATSLVTIPHLEFTKIITAASGTFTSCKALQNITIVGSIGCDINFESSTKLTHDSLMSIINALTDFSDDTSDTIHTLTIGHENLGKLTVDEISVAENKGWSVV